MYLHVFFHLPSPLTVRALLPLPCPMRTLVTAAGLLYLGIIICSPGAGPALTVLRLWGPRDRGPVGVHLLGLGVSDPPLGHPPGMVLVLLAVLVVDCAYVRICLPVERTRTVRRISPHWSLLTPLPGCGLSLVFLRL